MQKFNITLDEAVIEDPETYKTFNAFFTRKLKSEARPLDLADDSLISPCDGTISQLGKIEHHSLFQAKGKYFNLKALLAEDQEKTDLFKNGHFLTAYLSPRDYHRVHMPADGRLMKMVYVPGELFSVNPSSVKNIDNLFARNERVICYFQTPKNGCMAVIFVGAMLVASIVTQWHGPVAPALLKEVYEWDYSDQNHYFKKGDEIGYFQFGSTILLLTEEDQVIFDEALSEEDGLLMGQPLGFFTVSNGH